MQKVTQSKPSRSRNFGGQEGVLRDASMQAIQPAEQDQLMWAAERRYRVLCTTKKGVMEGQMYGPDGVGDEVRSFPKSSETIKHID